MKLEVTKDENLKEWYLHIPSKQGGGVAVTVDKRTARKLQEKLYRLLFSTKYDSN